MKSIKTTEQPSDANNTVLPLTWMLNRKVYRKKGVEKCRNINPNYTILIKSIYRRKYRYFLFIWKL